MKDEDITDSIIDEIVIGIFDSMSRFQKIYPIIKSDEIADILWKKYRVPIWKDVEIVRGKLRSWWATKQQYYEPHPHKWIGEHAVYLGSPMGRTYAMFRRGPTAGATDKGIIIAYTGETLKSIKEARERSTP